MIEELGRLSQLPNWLVEITRPGRVCAAVTDATPEIASGAVVLQRVKIKRMRVKQTFWSADYEMTIEQAGESRVLSVRGFVHPPGTLNGEAHSDGVIGHAGWRCTIPELGLALEMRLSSDDLPAIAALVDPTEAREILEHGIRTCSPGYADISIHACSPKVVRNKPGRCTILYELQYGPGAKSHWPELVVGKTYDTDRGHRVFEGMKALWNTELRDGAVVSIAEPLAFLPEQNLLVQGPVAGDGDLKNFLEAVLHSGDASLMEELRRYLAKAARGLVALHGCGVGYGAVATWEDELAEVTEVMARLTTLVPELGGATEPLLEKLASMADRFEAGIRVPCHRSFRPGQVLVHQGDVGFIDFDGLCRAEPALDVALFRSTMRSLGIRPGIEDGQDAAPLQSALVERLALLDDLCDRFLDEYQSMSPISRERIALWEAIDLLANVLSNWIKVRPHRLAASMALLEHYLEHGMLT